MSIYDYSVEDLEALWDIVDMYEPIKSINMPKLVIPANQSVKKGELFLILLNDIPIRLEATEDTYSASYDTSTWTDEFNPLFHGFRGMNMPICLLIASFINNIKVAEYITKKKSSL